MDALKLTFARDLIILENGKFDDSFSPSVKNYNLYPLFKSYWAYLFKKPIDEIPNTVLDTQNIIRNYFFKKLEWYEIYDFIEFTIKYLPNKFLQGKYKSTFIIFLCTRQISQNPYPIRILPS